MASKKKKAAPAAETTSHDPVTGELPVALPALSSAQKSIEVNGRTITLKKTVNRVLLRHQVGETVFIKIISPIREGKEIKGSAMAPANLVSVIEQTSGQEMDYIVSAVVKGLLEDTYPKAGYVGIAFALYKEPKAAGKRYNNFSLAEIEVK